MQVRQIKRIDLEKLMKAKGIKNIKQLAKMAKVDYTTLIKANNGYLVLSDKTWLKVEQCIQQW